MQYIYGTLRNVSFFELLNIVKTIHKLPNMKKKTNIGIQYFFSTILEGWRIDPNSKHLIEIVSLDNLIEFMDFCY